VHLAGKTSPIVSIQSILENVKDIPEFTKRIPVDRIIYDSGEEFDDPNGRYSKDDTIFDDFEDEEVMFTADGDIAFDGFGADAQRTIDVKEMVQEQGAEHAVYTLYNAAARTAEKVLGFAPVTF